MNNMNKTIKAKLILDSKGFGLVEVLVAAGIGSVVMMGMSQMMTSMNLSVRGTRTMASRDQLSTRIAREAGNSTSLGNSVSFTSNAAYPDFPANVTGSDLDKCSNGLVPNGCRAKDGLGNRMTYGFTLTDEFSVPIAGPDASRAAVYDVNGALCGNAASKPPTTNCPIIVTASFTPKCYNDTATCDRAISMDIHYSLAQASTVQLNGGPSLKTASGDVSTSIPFVANATGVSNMMAKWSTSTGLTASSNLFEHPITNRIGIGNLGVWSPSGPWGLLDVEETRSETVLGTAQTATMTVGQQISITGDSTANNVAGYFNVHSDGSSNHDLNTGINSLVGQANWFETSALLKYSHGVSGVTRNHNTGVIGTGIGTDGTVTNESTGTITTAAGVNGRVLNYTSTGTITTAYGGWFQIQPFTTGISGYKQITTGIGVFIDNMDAATKWALYSLDSGAASYFAGYVGVGTTARAYPLDVMSATAANISIHAVGDIVAHGSCVSGGADFAEWVDWTDKTKPEMGSVIPYKGSYVVVSSKKTAAFVGNGERDSSKSILVAFAGQLPVLVRGPVHVGDLVIANGDGTAKAVAKKDATIEMAQKAVGTAWEASDDPGLKRVNVAVGIGLSGGGARDIASLHELKQENAALSKEVSDLKSRLAQIEKALKLH